MNKNQLAFGIISSIISLTILLFFAELLQLRGNGALHPSTFSLLGWVSGMIGLFIAGATE